MPEHNETSSQQHATQQPKIVQMDMQTMMAMLGSLLQSQAETANMQKRLLERELAKDDATAKKEEAARIKIEKDRRQLLDQMDIKLKNDARKKAGCSHMDQKNGSTIWPISNSPDRQLRGVCTRCGDYIQPEHVELDGQGKPTLIPQHPLYHIVLQRDQAIYSEFVPLIGY